ncbi:protein-disulfide reductase DsbD [Agrobacterium sp. SOY23]|uniref:protein-disulfide reductase DsbD n=1 Tax=Agrobacterium sp. SOY23 TaxID=3014555 RepID=UPI0022AE92E2|nr:protein-disulfide reductase DsbD [Agrobacterium sp. SOY23]MCZ4431873.1 protein-disulfide reductase DsbD [Agrobacterium sp. SOY23]
MRILAFTIAMLAVLKLASSAGAVDAPLDMDQAFKMKVEQADDGGAFVRWTIADGYYLYREYLSADDQAGNKLEMKTPPGEAKDDPNFGSTEIYYSAATARIAGAPDTFRVTYQGCQDKGLCYPPTTKTVNMATMMISGESLFSQGSFAATNPASPKVSKGTNGEGFVVANDHARTLVDTMMADGGVVMLLAGFLGFGLLLAFTPCVFPMYPIVAAMLAREGERLTARRGLTLSLSYVVALAFAFGLLGVAAAWSGQNLQIVLQSTYAVGAIAILFVILALSNFGLFHIQLPAAVSARFAKTSKGAGSIPGAMILGFSSALLIGPCVTAPLAGALLYVARTGDMIIGAVALFALGLGKGIPLVVMATAGGNAFPKAGLWMEKVRQVFGFMFLATALWLAAPLIATTFVMLGWAVIALSFGVFAFSAAAGHAVTAMNMMSRTTGLASIIWALMLFVSLGIGGTDPLTPLQPFRSNGVAERQTPIKKSDFATVSSMDDLSARIDGVSHGKPTLLYVTADWCVTCRTIERSVLTSPDVMDALSNLNLVSLDLTSLDADRKALLSALKVVGPPTMVFLDQNRTEPASTRLVGEFSAADLSASAQRASGMRP